MLTVVIVEICDDHLGTGVHESLDDSATEARRAARDDSDLPG
jgi:hypothetical protein